MISNTTFRLRHPENECGNLGFFSTYQVQKENATGEREDTTNRTEEEFYTEQKKTPIVGQQPKLLEVFFLK